MSHALLSPSGADRWINCPRSARFEQKFPESPPSTFSEEGSAAHLYARNEIAAYLGLAPEPIPKEYEQFFNAQFQSDYRNYVDFAINKIKKTREESPNVIIFLERKVDASIWIPEGFGTVDLTLITNDEINVVDLKFGKGIRVDAEVNPQLRIYGAAALNMFDHLFEIKKVVMTIVQPRLNHISVESLSKDELVDWMETVVQPAAALAWNGQGQFIAGNHCKWCRAKAQCSARAQANTELARFDFAAPGSMADEAIGHVLTKAAMLHSWVKDIEEFAYLQALKGRIWPGFKLVEGRSTRKFVDNDAVTAALIDAGVDSELLYERSLRSMTELEKRVGKNMFARILGDLVVKSPGKPTLVPSEDRRPEFYPTAADPAADFSLISE